jgi:hypothetical protein
MNDCFRARASLGSARLLFLLVAASSPLVAQQIDNATILQKVDAAVKARVDGIEAYTVTEHYAVLRDKDEKHPVADMTVKTTYKRETGKSYQILSESGSTLMRNLVLQTILDNEKHVNEPGVREGSWITTANYEMQVKPGGIQKMDGRDCVAIALTPRRKEPFLLLGTLWVDAQNGEIVRLEGKASKSSSVFTGETEMMRQYVDLDGFGEAIHARAESDSFLFGPTVVTIEYKGYQIQKRSEH